MIYSKIFFLRHFVLFLFSTFLITTSVYAGGPFDRTGYLKDKGKNRIFTISFKKGTSEKEINAHANSLPNTSGRMTAAYYFVKGRRIPSNSITLARNIFNANSILYDTPGFDKWVYAYMKGYNGSTKFVNCNFSPDNELCRTTD